MPEGGCHCGAVRYEMPTEVVHRALCHCTDCRRHAEAPMVAWGLVAKDRLDVTGETRTYASSEHGRRHFCGTCGTALFYTNETIFPDMIDVQICTLDDPDSIPIRSRPTSRSRSRSVSAGWPTPTLCRLSSAIPAETDAAA